MEPRALLTFGDSSGNPSRSKRGYEDSTHYIIVTATMDMREAQRVDAQAEALKAKYFGGINPERVSFHGHQLLNKLFRHAGNRLHAKQQFKETFVDVVKIAKNMDSTINAVIMDKRFPDENHRSSNTITSTWTQVSQMMRQNLLDSPSGTTCAIILDRYDTATNRIVSSTISKLLHPLANPCKFSAGAPIPRPMFVDSTSCNLVQLVDMLTFAIAKIHTSPTRLFMDLQAELCRHFRALCA